MQKEIRGPQETGGSPDKNIQGEFTYGVNELRVLGSVVSHGKIKPDPEKIRGIVEARPPRNRRDLETFLGAAGYHRGHIPGYSALVAHFSTLRRKGCQWEGPSGGVR